MLYKQLFLGQFSADVIMCYLEIGTHKIWWFKLGEILFISYKIEKKLGNIGLMRKFYHLQGHFCLPPFPSTGHRRRWNIFH